MIGSGHTEYHGIRALNAVDAFGIAAVNSDIKATKLLLVAVVNRFCFQRQLLWLV